MIAMNKKAQPLYQRAAIYVRVSTVDQEEEGTSLDTQEAACRRYALDKGFVVDDGYIYREVFSGTMLRERPRLTDLREAVRSRGIQAVVCYALDRLSRNQAHIYILAEEFEDSGARLEFVTESFEDSAVGRFIRSAKAFAAEVEHEKIKERTERGRVARAHSGKLIPGWKALYGYAWADEDKSRYKPAEPEAATVQRIFRSVAQGDAIRSIAGRLTLEGIPTPSGRGSVWRASTVGHILSTPAYMGYAASFGSTIRAARTATSAATGQSKSRSCCLKARCRYWSIPRCTRPFRSVWHTTRFIPRART